MIRVRVRFFSIFSDHASDTELVFSSRVSVKELLDEVLAKNPSLKSVLEYVKPIILVNGTRVSEEYVLNNGDEVALIPPVSGG